MKQHVTVHQVFSLNSHSSGSISKENCNAITISLIGKVNIVEQTLIIYNRSLSYYKNLIGSNKEQCINSLSRCTTFRFYIRVCVSEDNLVYALNHIISLQLCNKPDDKTSPTNQKVNIKLPSTGCPLSSLYLTFPF